MSITVVDPAGNLIAHETMDRTQYASISISQAKARTAALYCRPSGALMEAVNGGGVASPGGFPIVIDGMLVGAIGASGGIFTQNSVTAKAGLATFDVK